MLSYHYGFRPVHEGKRYLMKLTHGPTIHKNMQPSNQVLLVTYTLTYRHILFGVVSPAVFVLTKLGGDTDTGQRKRQGTRMNFKEANS